MLDTDTIKEEIVKFLEDHKALDLRILDLEERTSIAKYMVIASGTSQRHIGAMAELLRQRLGQLGLSGTRLEGMPECHWVLLDIGDVMVHLFRPEVRIFYNLEKLWG
jgi:ribosome-associated protein